MTCALPPRHSAPVTAGQATVRVLSKQYTAACATNTTCAATVAAPDALRLNASASAAANGTVLPGVSVVGPAGLCLPRHTYHFPF